ncbi:MAG TPA: hypothetical protein VMZ92_17315 [Planctomycetota bacterium]|nr:hypothetical protein [Planctomycetota bacterium]
MNGDAAAQIRDAAWKRARRIAWLMLAAPALYVVIGPALLKARNVPRLADLGEGLRDGIFFIFVAVSVLDFLTAVVLSRAMLSPHYVTRRFRGMGSTAQHYGQVHVLIGAMCQGPAVLGLVYFVLTGDLERMVLCAGAGVLFSLVLLPRRATLEKLLRAVRQQESSQC